MAEESLTRMKCLVTVEGDLFTYVIVIPPSVAATVGSESVVGLRNLIRTSCGLADKPFVLRVFDDAANCWVDLKCISDIQGSAIKVGFISGLISLFLYKFFNLIFSFLISLSLFRLGIGLSYDQIAEQDSNNTFNYTVCESKEGLKNIARSGADRLDGGRRKPNRILDCGGHSGSSGSGNKSGNKNSSGGSSGSGTDSTLPIRRRNSISTVVSGSKSSDSDSDRLDGGRRKTNRRNLDCGRRSGSSGGGNESGNKSSSGGRSGCGADSTLPIRGRNSISTVASGSKSSDSDSSDSSSAVQEMGKGVRKRRREERAVTDEEQTLVTTRPPGRLSAPALSGVGWP